MAHAGSRSVPRSLRKLRVGEWPELLPDPELRYRDRQGAATGSYSRIVAPPARSEA
jgi:hypothetical protein